MPIGFQNVLELIIDAHCIFRAKTAKISIITEQKLNYSENLKISGP